MEAKKDNAAAGEFTRLRFSVELKPGKTTVVSWKKLLREANIEYPSSDSDSIDDPVDYIQEEKESSTKNSGSLINREKVLQLTARTESSKSANDHTKKRRKDIMDSLDEKDGVQLPTKYKKKGHQQIKVASETAPSVGPHSISQVLNVQNHDGNLQNLRNSSGVSLKKNSDSSGRLDCLSYAKPSKGDAHGFPVKAHCKAKIGTVHSRDPVNNVVSFVPNAAHQKYLEKKSAQLNPQSSRSMCNNHEQEGSINVHLGNHKGRNELPDLNLPYTRPASRTASKHLTDASNSKEKMLERAIRRLEKLVETSKTPLINVQEADASSVAVERSLPQELKEKLAEVARLTQLIDGNISEELIDRLMSILGKSLHRKTLKRILREMVLKELSVSKEEDNDFKQFKKEIVEMIRLQAPALKAKASEHQDELPNDFQRLSASEDKVGRGVYVMDNKVEDKLCDLYDAYVQGLDEYIGHSLVRKLYVQLAALWPKGTMDNHGIRKAICRAKERKRILSSEEKDGEKPRRNKLSMPRTDDHMHGKASSATQARAVHEKFITGTSGLVSTLPDMIVPSMRTADKHLATKVKKSSLKLY